VEPVDGVFIKPKLVAVDYKNLRFVLIVMVIFVSCTYQFNGMSHVKLTLSFVIRSTAI
jgi:hypothetical protein